jgi:hypothetical protein
MGEGDDTGPPEGSFDDRDEVPVLAPPDPTDAEERTEFAPVTPLHTAAAAEDRVAGLADRLSHLESALASVGVDADHPETGGTERLMALEQRLLHEVASQRRDLMAAIEDRFARLEAALRDGLAALRAESPEEEPDEPA